MARANGVHDAIEKGESRKHHRAGKRIVAFEALDPGRKLTLHALLRAQHPAEDAAEGARRLLRGAWGGEGGRRRCRRALCRRHFRSEWIERLDLRVGGGDRHKEKECANCEGSGEAANDASYK
jgi:hypothetical protein